MKLNMYEIARSFAVENWSYIMEVAVYVLLDSQEDSFRIRGLLYTTAIEDVDAADDDDNFFVASFNDTPFDSECTPFGPRSVANVWLAPTLCQASIPRRVGSYGCFLHEGELALVRWYLSLVTLREAVIQ
jgi:hypothetical protein